ncbi:MAG: FtsX-like permease family protein [Candidatus Aminicenantes bacterium]|nr:FtsX-like permease family protein [Candidatus Aminicenantes bacterium]
MIRFLSLGLWRDRSRSLFPLLTVIFGVMLTVVLFSWIKGFEDNFLQTNARLGSGHVAIMSRAYAAEADQLPNDLALTGVGGILERLRRDFPAFAWTPRIHFAGLLDVPDKKGETRAQGPVGGLAFDLFSTASPEKSILNLELALVRGVLPQKKGEVLLADEFAANLGIGPGATVTLIASTMYGGMATANFTVAGTFRFGAPAMDRSMMIADISTIRALLDMDDAAGEIVGFFRAGFYDREKAERESERFNNLYHASTDPFAPQMATLLHLSGMSQLLGWMDAMLGAIVAIFLTAMFIVLWNTGLMGNIRRYGETGVRLALGETKGHVYRSMISEAAIVGLIGSIIGTTLGLALAFYVQKHGFDFSGMMRNASMLMTTRFHARVTGTAFYIGFIPGVAATVLGAATAGRAIYKRQTSRLLKELEA